LTRNLRDGTLLQRPDAILRLTVMLLKALSDCVSRRGCALKFLFILAFLFSIATAGESCARDVLGLNKLSTQTMDRLQDSIDKARESGVALSHLINQQARDRLDQVNKIVQDAIKGISAEIDHADALAEKYIEQLRGLAAEFNRQITEHIERVFCNIAITVEQRLSQALGSVGRLLGTHTIEIISPILYPGEKTLFGSTVTKEFRIGSSFYYTFAEIERYLIVERLGQSRDDTPISSMVISYQMLANLASRGGCLDNDRSGYATRYARYMNLVAMWKRLAGDGVTMP
jgi:hypothetical protein